MPNQSAPAPDAGAAAEPQDLVLTPDLPFLPSGFEPWFKDDFSTAFLFDNLPVSGTQFKTVSIDASNYFVATQVNAVVSDQATGLVVKAIEDAPVMVEISDTSSRTQYQNQPVRIGTLCGTGNRPGYYDRRGLIFRPGSSIKVTLTNLDAGNAWRVDLTFKGFNIFKLPDLVEF